MVDQKFYDHWCDLFEEDVAKREREKQKLYEAFLLEEKLATEKEIKRQVVKKVAEDIAGEELAKKKGTKFSWLIQAFFDDDGSPLGHVVGKVIADTEKHAVFEAEKYLLEKGMVGVRKIKLVKQSGNIVEISGMYDVLSADMALSPES